MTNVSSVLMELLTHGNPLLMHSNQQCHHGARHGHRWMFHKILQLLQLYAYPRNIKYP